jgi:tRNA 5-methylaminomethyl-2-thiouridine biosynthesis bifunctional protein
VSTILQVKNKNLFSKDGYSEKRAIVIGGGLAGCSTASELAKAGWQITLIEREPSIASKASGNPRGIVYCKFSDGPDANTDYYLNSYLFALQHYQKVSKIHSIDWQTCGLIQIAHDKREEKRQAQTINNFKDANFIQPLDALAASKVSGIKLDKGGLFLPSGGFLNPQALCQAYIQHDNIKCITNTEALSLKFENNVWLLESTHKNIIKAPVVIIANSHDALSFKQTGHYPLLMNYGQIDEYPETSISKTLSCIICAKGYISPAYGKSHFIGGITKTTEPALSDANDFIEQNLQLTHSINQKFMEELKRMGPTNIRTGSRCSSPDYLPIIGPVENKKNCRKIYKELYRNAKQKVSQTPDYEPGLYINVAHGSHGLTSTPIIASYLARLINYSPLPLSNASINSLHPIRYLIRDLKKQRL